jgi:glutamine synthetase
VSAALGDHILGAFISEKRAEWAEYREQVHGWEIDKYLDRY